MSISFQNACFSFCMKTMLSLPWKWEIVRINGMMNPHCLKTFNQGWLSWRVIVLSVGGTREGSDPFLSLRPFSGPKMMSMMQISFFILSLARSPGVSAPADSAVCVLRNAHDLTLVWLEHTLDHAVGLLHDILVSHFQQIFKWLHFVFRLWGTWPTQRCPESLSLILQPEEPTGASMLLCVPIQKTSGLGTVREKWNTQ